MYYLFWLVIVFVGCVGIGVSVYLGIIFSKKNLKDIEEYKIDYYFKKKEEYEKKRPKY